MKNIDILSNVKYLKEQSNPSIPIFMFAYKIEIENRKKIAELRETLKK